MQQQLTAPLKRIKLGRNPRTYFDPKAMAELTESIRAHGVDTPIIVRPVTEDEFDYEVIAGGRRYRGAMDAHGENFPMPIVVKDVDEVEARRIALTENIQRDNLSPSEEAVDAAELLGLHGGDRDVTAKILGWSRSTLDSRLALLNCSKAVLDALSERKINIAHAELLAALSKENQDRVLPVVVAEKRSVADVKKLVESASCALASAIFDKADCAGCPHNSSTQAQMFGEAIGTGNCTNRTCFNEKTEKQLEATAAGLRDEFQAVRIVRAGDNNTRVQLAVEGTNGVGLEQAQACHGCANYGAAVSGLPDSIGKVYRGQCFDTVCNMQKVAARIKAEKAAKQPQQADGGKSAPAAKSASGTGSKSASAPASTNPSVTVIAESERVKAYRVKLWRKALRVDIGMNHELARQYLIAVVLSGHARQIDDGAFRKFFEKIADSEAPLADLPKAVDAVQAVGESKQADLMIAMLFAAIEGLEVTYLTKLCKAHKLDLKKHWKLDKEFLELITKSEMLVLAEELGIRAALGDNFKKVFAKSKPEVIEALLKVEGFDYTGKLPKVLKF
ncbi:PRTRC system ParB family protein [Paraburkholderia sp. SARCC-3016]|uniref:PRTRC system ParB family protein n=1 Tax=Paraburkholderia sp. SARCC-3016 TaxID=3058611 RepID=UPI002809F72D|nr:PRTRC system ParB family protein [Paraburkholderia sp. SARCC-3016]MDQ7979962.1 PRTRC system ParB family protein [Paraburkholderia sp. SARCC-3016]